MSDIALATPDRTAAASDHGATAAEIAWQWRREVGGAPARAAAAARRKGALGGVIGLAAAAALYFWKPHAAELVATIAVATTLLALLSPLGGFRRLTAALEAFGRGVGLVATWLLMSLAYYLLFLPLGLLLRAAGKLRITRGADARCVSYWVAHEAPVPGIERYRKPF